MFNPLCRVVVSSCSVENQHTWNYTSLSPAKWCQQHSSWLNSRGDKPSTSGLPWSGRRLGLSIWNSALLFTSKKMGIKQKNVDLSASFFSSLHVLVVQLDATINTSEPGIVAAWVGFERHSCSLILFEPTWGKQSIDSNSNQSKSQAWKPTWNPWNCSKLALESLVWWSPF